MKVDDPNTIKVKGSKKKNCIFIRLDSASL